MLYQEQGSRACDCSDRVFTRRAKPNRENESAAEARDVAGSGRGRRAEWDSHTVARSVHEGKSQFQGKVTRHTIIMCEISGRKVTFGTREKGEAFLKVIPARPASGLYRLGRRGNKNILPFAVQDKRGDFM